MKAYWVVLALVLATPIEVNAQTSPDARKKAVAKLFSKHSCESFNDSVCKSKCELSYTVLSHPEFLNEPEPSWKRFFNGTESEMVECEVEQDRISSNRKPKLGMTKDYIYKHVLGPPDAINDTVDGRGMTSQWVFRGENETLYLYFNNKGTLASMQRNSR